jgi:hypothetical protein
VVAFDRLSFLSGFLPFLRRGGQNRVPSREDLQIEFRRMAGAVRHLARRLHGLHRGSMVSTPKTFRPQAIELLQLPNAALKHSVDLAQVTDEPEL